METQAWTPPPRVQTEVIHVSCIRATEITILQQFLRMPALPTPSRFLHSSKQQPRSPPSATKAVGWCPVWRAGTERASPTRDKTRGVDSVSATTPFPTNTLRHEQLCSGELRTYMQSPVFTELQKTSSSSEASGSN